MMALVLAWLAAASGHGREAGARRDGARGDLHAVRGGRAQLAMLLLRCAGPSAGWQMLRHIQQRPIWYGTTLAMESPLLSRCHGIVSLAKKKGGKGKKKNKKDRGPTFAEIANFEVKPAEGAELRELAETTVSSYSSRSGGKSLWKTRTRSSDTPKALWAEPLAVMVVKEAESSDTPAEVVYANQAALEMHGLASDGYKTLFGSPSTLPVKMHPKKYESGYSKKLTIAADGLQLDKSGADENATTVKMLEAERWLLEKMAVVDGKLATQSLGVAYAWDTWQLANGMLAKPGGELFEPEEPPEPLPSREEAQASLDKVAASIRKLKGEDGKTNQDPEVVELVVELKKLKEILADYDD